MVSSANRSVKLRELIQQGVVMMPGAFNALSARLIEREGFDAIYLSGAVLANSVGGVPDVGMMTLTEARDHALHVANASTLPILMDADTGFGDGAHMLMNTDAETLMIHGCNLAAETWNDFLTELNWTRQGVGAEAVHHHY